MKVAVVVRAEPVEPLLSGLVPTVLRPAAGGAVTKHAGTILFPESAFAPTNDVQIIIIPETGSNVEIELTKARLAALKTGRNIEAVKLIGLTDVEVKQMIAEPTDTSRDWWRYIRGGLRLYVYFDATKHVVDVNPKDGDLTSIMK